MNNGLGSRRILSKGIYVGHDVVAHCLLPLGSNRKGLVAHFEMRLHLVQRFGGYHLGAVGALESQLPLT